MGIHKRWLLIIGLVLMLVGAGGFLLRSKLKPAQAGILVETSPQATVYINGEQVGVTPYDGVRAPGEITIRLLPVAVSGGLAPWDTKLTLTQGIKTVVRRDFGETQELSAGEVLSFEKSSGYSPSMTIVSDPDASQVVVDGEGRGFTPKSIDSIAPGEHKVIVSQTGYITREIAARAESGYKLTVISMLAQDPNYVPPTADQVQDGTEKIEILNTSTGFLRVRSEASTEASEAARVKPGEKFVILEETKDKDWYKIEYEKGKKGWISAKYAKKIEESEDNEKN